MKGLSKLLLTKLASKRFPESKDASSRRLLTLLLWIMTRAFAAATEANVPWALGQSHKPNQET